jgi:hypothetical protein
MPAPGWPGVPVSPPANSGPGSGENPIVPSSGGCGEYHLEVPMYKNDKGEDVGMWVNDCGQEYYGTKSQSYAVTKMNLIPHCNDGSGVIILPGNTKTPCDQINEQREDQDFKDEVANLQSKTGLKKETGYTSRSDGSSTYHDNASATDEKNSLALPLATESYNKNITCFMHTHVDDYEYTDSDGIVKIKQGIKVFSPADVAYFMQLIANALEQGRPLDSVCGIMISSMNNYQIRFTGNQYQIKTFTKDQIDKHRDTYRDYLTDRRFKSNKLEFGFLKYMDEKMNLKGLSLYRMNADGSTTEIKLNNDKTNTIETNCPK